MATVSMTKGAELAGVSKGTVSKALKSGRLSYAEKTDNGYLIDTSELFRVFPPKQAQSAPSCDFGQVGERFGNVAFGIDDGNHRRGQFAPS